MVFFGTEMDNRDVTHSSYSTELVASPKKIEHVISHYFIQYILVVFYSSIFLGFAIVQFLEMSGIPFADTFWPSLATENLVAN